MKDPDLVHDIVKAVTAATSKPVTIKTRKGFDESRLKAIDTLQDAMNLANALKTEKKKYILLENDLPDNYNEG